MAEEQPDPYLLLTADPVPVAGHGILFTGPGGQVRVEGPEAESFASRIAALADGTRTTMRVMADLLDLPATGVDRWMADLAAGGLLVQIDPATPPGARALAGLGLDPDGMRALATTRVAVVGSDAVTGSAARALGEFGIDVLPVAAERGAPGGGAPVSREELAASVRGCDALVSSLQPGLLRAAQWVNLVALDAGIPALFGAAAAATGWAGPLVFPGKGPCLLCYRMRVVACARDFEDAMAIEEWRARPGAASAVQPVGTAATVVGGVMAMEIVKAVTGLAEPTLVGAVCEIDGLSHERTLHRFLQRRDCPACRKKGRPPRLRAEQPGGPVDLDRLVPHLVSSFCGVIRTLEAIPADVTEPRVPVVRCELANNQLRGADQSPFQPCSGKGSGESAALRSALGEACERYAATAWPVDLVRRARPAEAAHDSLGPNDLVLFDEDQYEALPYSPWDPDAEIGWVEGVDVGTGGAVAIPAVAVLFGYDGSPADQLFAPNSNGLAAGPSFEAATLGATLEVVERDAFLMAWMHGLPGARVDPYSVDNPIVCRLAEAYRRRDVSLELYRLVTDVAAVTVYLAIGVQCSDRAVGPGPAALIGLGADLSGNAAAAKAVLEVAQVRPALKARLRDPAVRRRRDELSARPELVSSLEDHDLLYAHPEMLPALDFWRDQRAGAAVPDEASPTEEWERLAVLVDSLAEAGHRLVSCDLTPPELGTFGVHVARALVPGFQPIHFGANEARLGGRRLFHLPHDLGLRPSPASRAALNVLPHPLS